MQIAEQIVGIPVPHGFVGKRRLQGFSQYRVQQRRLLWNAFLSGLEQNVDISSGAGLGQGASSSAGLADEDFTGVFRTFPHGKKVRSAGQVVSAKLGGHVSSSTLSAHQMARAREPVDSDGSEDYTVAVRQGFFVPVVACCGCGGDCRDPSVASCSSPSCRRHPCRASSFAVH